MSKTFYPALIVPKLVLACGFALSACSQTFSSPSVPTGSLVGRAPNVLTRPKITSVTRIVAKQIQKIVISGSGFGRKKPYDGDSPYIKIRDITANWNAGHVRPAERDEVTLDITSWNNQSIVIAGFTGAYGTNGWSLSKGDSLTIKVWNAQSAAGPAQWNGKAF